MRYLLLSLALLLAACGADRGDTNINIVGDCNDVEIDSNDENNNGTTDDSDSCGNIGDQSPQPSERCRADWEYTTPAESAVKFYNCVGADSVTITDSSNAVVDVIGCPGEINLNGFHIYTLSCGASYEITTQ